MARVAHAPRLLELERRDVPAGNVTVIQIGHELRVIGDAAANNFTIRGHGPGVVEIQGTGTTINGGNAKVTATGVEWLRVSGAAGDDIIKTRDLAIGDVDVFGNTGNDVLDLAATTGGALSLGLFTDTGLTLSANGGDGDDTIRVTGTNVRGDLGGIFVNGDGGRNSITVSNFRVAPAGDYGGILNLSVYNGSSGQPGPGNDVTIDGLYSDMVGPDADPSFGWFSWYIDINGADADDTIRLRNWDLSGRSNDADLIGEMYVFGWEGTDRMEVENVALSGSTTDGIGRYNQVGSAFEADQIKMRNVRHEGGVFDGEFPTGSFIGVTAADADLKNVAISSDTGYANLLIQSPFDDPTRDTSITLANVTVRGGGGSSTDVYTSDGNDSVRATNCELGRVSATLGEGNDSLTFVNVTFSATYNEEFGYGGILTGGGDDTVSFTNCEGEAIYIDTGDGDDTVNMTNCVFVTADLFGEDGDDDLNLTNNDGMFNFDGFEL